jgi:hypothetical protein
MFITSMRPGTGPYECKPRHSTHLLFHVHVGSPLAVQSKTTHYILFQFENENAISRSGCRPLSMKQQ